MLDHLFPAVFLAESKETSQGNSYRSQTGKGSSVFLGGTNRPSGRAVAQEVTSLFGFLRLKEWPVPRSWDLTAFWAIAFLQTRLQKREKTIGPLPQYRKWYLL